MTCAIGLVLTGLLSDRIHVRKPFMLVGGAGFTVLAIVFIGTLTDPATSYGTLRALLIGRTAFQGCSMCRGWPPTPRHSRARSSRPASPSGAGSSASWSARCSSRCRSRLGRLEAPPAAVLQAQGAKLKAEQSSLERDATALRDQGASLQARGTAFQTSVAKLQATAKAVPERWQTWLWLCVAGQLVFIPLALLLRGRWSPSGAAVDLSRHDIEIDRALDRIRSGGRPA
jgi:hypothetical protein